MFANSTNKVFLKSKIGNIRFNTKTNLGEDFDFVLQYFMNIEKYKYYKKCFYTYDLTTGSLGIKFKKNTFELKSVGNFRLLDLYKKNGGNLTDVYKEFVKAFVLDMTIFMTSSNNNKMDMIENQKHCMDIFDLSKIDLPFKLKIIFKIFNSKNYYLVKICSFFVRYINIIIKKIKYGL